MLYTIELQDKLGQWSVEYYTKNEQLAVWHFLDLAMKHGQDNIRIKIKDA